MDAKLAMKIYNVMCATESLEKELTVGKPGSTSAYKAVGEKTVLNMIKPLFKNEKLIILPVDGSISENLLEYVDGYGKNKLRAITQLKVCFDIVDAETGESTRIVGFGNGADSQDKGSGKAFTYALKTALQKSFLMFSGEDTDNTHSDEINKSQEQSTGVAPKQTYTKREETTGDRKVSTQELTDLAKQKHVPLSQLFDMHKKESGKTTDDVKYFKGEYKIKYYDMLSKMPDIKNG